MISVFYINRYSKIVICGLIGLLVFLFVYCLWFSYSVLQEAKKYQRVEIDRSNAMQVSKNIEGESQSSPNSLQVSLLVPDFFTEYRLERDKIRSERTDLLRDILKNAKTEESKQQAQSAILQMTLEKQIESEIENLIKSRGFGDALVFLRENSVSAIVKTTSLSKEEVIQVADIISKISGAKTEDITISAKP